MKLSRRVVMALVVLSQACLISSSWAQATLQVIRTNGPTSRYLNVVYLSEGYTTNELPQFLVNVTNVMNKLLAAPPFVSYSNYFNVFAISVASAESGSDHLTPTVVTKDTYFNSTYDSSGIQRLITIDSTGRSRLNSL